MRNGLFLLLLLLLGPLGPARRRPSAACTAGAAAHRRAVCGPRAAGRHAGLPVRRGRRPGQRPDPGPADSGRACGAAASCVQQGGTRPWWPWSCATRPSGATSTCTSASEAEGWKLVRHPQPGHDAPGPAHGGHAGSHAPGRSGRLRPPHPDASHAFTVGNLRLWTSADADIAAHFRRNRADFRKAARLVQAGGYFGPAADRRPAPPSAAPTPTQPCAPCCAPVHQPGEPARHRLRQLPRVRDWRPHPPHRGPAV